MSGIGLIVAAHVRRIRERHWDKVALSAAALVFVALMLNTVLDFSYPHHMQPLPMSEDAFNKTYVTCPALLDLSAMRAAANSTESVLCPKGTYHNLFVHFLQLCMCPLCLTAFGLDVRHYVPLLVTEVVVNSIIVMGLSFRVEYLYFYEGDFPNVKSNFFIFSCLCSASLMWSSLSSESAGRGAWIRQQNWDVFRQQLLRELGPHSALLSDPMRKVGPDPNACPHLVMRPCQSWP